MARRFGGIATDAVIDGLKTTSIVRSFSIWTFRTGGGGNNFGRIFDKRTIGGLVEELVNNEVGAVYEYRRYWTTAVPATWTIPIPALNVWNNIIVTYSGTSTANDPLIYLNGNPQVVTETIAPSGTILVNNEAYILGNRLEANRVWAGSLCEFAVWDRVISPFEAFMIGAGKQSAAWFPVSLVEYLPLRNGYNSRFAPTAVPTGTVFAEHPLINYPPSMRDRPMTRNTFLHRIGATAVSRRHFLPLLGAGS